MRDAKRTVARTAEPPAGFSVSHSSVRQYGHANAGGSAAISSCSVSMMALANLSRRGRLLGADCMYTAEVDVVESTELALLVRSSRKLTRLDEKGTRAADAAAEADGDEVTAAAEAIHAVRGGPEGRGKVELVDGPAGGGPEPEPLDGTTVGVEGGFHGPHVQRTILHPVVEADDAASASRSEELDLPVSGGTAGEESENVRLG